MLLAGSTHQDVDLDINKGKLGAVPKCLLFAVHPVVFANVLLEAPVPSSASFARSHQLPGVDTYQIASILSSSVNHDVVLGKLGNTK